MKRLHKSIPYIFVLCGIFFFSFLPPQHKGSAYLKLKQPKYDFGTVEQGKVVKIEYEFSNSGTQPLIISTIEVTCGCTVADFPRHPIKPGDTGIILLTFNTKEKYGYQDRVSKIISNATNSPTKIRFKGTVLEPKSDKKDK